MCGILGFSGAFDPAALRAGLEAIAHRGPDDSGVFTNGLASVGLGHVRLSILELSPLGHQPMLGADGAVVLVFNGEIYNFQELRAELQSKVQLSGNSDTEVLLNLYPAEGEAMLPRLNGIFAFALWDARTQCLLLARDALGVKPLYVATTSQGIAFGSEIKGLMPLMPQKLQLDAVSLHRYLSFLWCPGEGTPLKSVHKLLPGEAMLVRAGVVVRRWQWYQLPVFRPRQAVLSESAALQGTVNHLRQAVQRQMVADAGGCLFVGWLGFQRSSGFCTRTKPEHPLLHH
ncbi:asparagine synthetase B family protein [Candidatus Aalborgicola defluviihabitans]|uniref:asparagine synthetase B family protein n=1 Tax=Candidatus Aalborgicola defluviihabitans TaxID=3386187 RepID=UPI0039B9BCA6